MVHVNIFVAFKEEINYPFLSQKLIEENVHPQLIVTGPGKIAATAKAFQALQGSASLNINAGTSGSSKFPVGEVFQISKHYMHDLRIPEELFESLGKLYTPITNEPIINSLPIATLATGDSFVEEENEAYDLFDMEGYSYSWAFSGRNNLFDKRPYRCIKIVSDNINEKSAAEWPNKMDELSERLTDKVFHYIINFFNKTS